MNKLQITLWKEQHCNYCSYAKSWEYYGKMYLFCQHKQLLYDGNIYGAYELCKEQRTFEE